MDITTNYILNSTLLAAVQAIRDCNVLKLIVRRLDSYINLKWLKEQKDDRLLPKLNWMTLYFVGASPAAMFNLLKDFHKSTKIRFDKGYDLLDNTRDWLIDWSVYFSDDNFKIVREEGEQEMKEVLQDERDLWSSPIVNVYEGFLQALMWAIVLGGKYCNSVEVSIPRSVKEDADIVGTYRQLLLGQRLEPEYWRLIRFEGLRDQETLNLIANKLDDMGIVFDTGGNEWNFDWSFTIEDRLNVKVEMVRDGEDR